MIFFRKPLFPQALPAIWLLLVSLLVAVPFASLQAQQTGSATAPLILRGDSVDSVLVLLEKLTGRSVIRPQGLPAPLFNFTSQRPLTVEERITAIESLLALNGIAVTPQGDLFLKVVPASSITGRTPQFVEGDLAAATATDGIFTRFFTLNHLTTGEIQPLLQPFLSPGTGQLFLYEKSNSILITDSMVNLKRVEEVLREVDQPSNPNVVVKFYSIEHATASEIVVQVESIITAGYGKYLNANSTIRADDRTNQVIVVTHPSNLPVIEQFIKEIDKDEGLSIFNEAIPLRHGDAAEITGILNEIVSGQANPNSRSNRRTPGTQTQTRPNQATESQPAAEPAPTVTVRGANRASGEDRGLQFSEQLTIVADERSNALIVTGTTRDIEQAKQLIEKIDVLLPQVRIDVLIAEVSLTETMNTGLEAFGFRYGGDSSSSGFLNVETGGVSLSPSPGNNIIPLDELTMDIVLKKAETDGNIRLINVPTIVTTHNQEATIIVGESRPLVTGTQTSLGAIDSGSLRSTVQYRDIGIELTVTPLIGSNGIVQMQIDQTVDNTGETVEIDGNQQPIITRRQATSFVSVQNGKLITLAGFQEAFVNKNKSKIGIFGYIPIVNLLINPRSEENREKELIFFIRPKILKTSEDVDQDAVTSVDRFGDPELVDKAISGDVHLLRGNEKEPETSDSGPGPQRKGFNK